MLNLFKNEELMGKGQCTLDKSLSYLFGRTVLQVLSTLRCLHWRGSQTPSSFGPNELWEKHWMSRRPAIWTIINRKPDTEHFVKLTSRKIPCRIWYLSTTIGEESLDDKLNVYLVLTHFLDEQEGMQPCFVVFPRESWLSYGLWHFEFAGLRCWVKR